MLEKTFLVEPWAKDYAAPDCIPKTIRSLFQEFIAENGNDWSGFGFSEKCLPGCEEEIFTMTRSSGDLNYEKLNMQDPKNDDSQVVNFITTRFYFSSFDYNKKIVYQDTISDFMCK